MDGEALVLILAGIPYIFYGGQGNYAPTPWGLMPVSTPRKVLNVIDLQSLSNTSIENRLPRYGGVGTATSITLKLVDVANHLELLFSRTIEDVHWVRLGESLEADDTNETIPAATAIPDAFPADGYGYIGLETFEYDAYEDDTFTLALTQGRGALNSQVSQHLVDNIPARSFKPVITNQPIHWQNRGAVLYLHKVINGEVSNTPERELLRGYLDGVPQPIDGGWEIRLTSELGKWTRYIGTALETTRLVRGFHYSDGVNACKLSLLEHLPHDCISSSSDDCVQMEEHLEGDGVVVVRSVNTLRTVFGVARGHFDGDPSIANLGLRNFGGNQLPSVVSSYGAADSDTITLAEDNMPEVLDAQVGDLLHTYHRVVQFPVFKYSDDNPVLAEGLHRWPEAIITEFNNKANVTLTPDGGLSFLDCTLTPDGTRLTVAVNGYTYNASTPPLLLPRTQDKAPPYLWYPLFRQVDEAIDEDERRGRPVAEDAASSGYQVGYHQLQAPAEAFWCGGRYLLVKDNVFPVPAEGESMSLTVRIRGGKEIKLNYNQVTEQSYDGAVIGYRLRITQDSIEQWRADGSIPFGTWVINGELFEPEIFPSGLLGDNGGLPSMLNSIMLSGSGTYGYSDPVYDRLPRALGLSVNPAALDHRQILYNSFVPLFSRLEDFNVTAQTVAKDVVRGYLLAAGLALVMRCRDGVQKIQVVPVRATTEPASGEVRDGIVKDWSRRNGRPRSGVLDKLQSTWLFETNYDKESKKFLRTPIIHDADVIDIMGGAENPAEKITLKGLNLDSDQELVFTYQKLRSRFGKQTKVFSGSIMWSVASQVDIGDVLTVTTIDGVDENRLPKTITANMLVVAISHNFFGKTCKVELEQVTTNYGRIAPAARVVEVVDADTLRFGNDYAQGINPGYVWFLDYDGSSYSLPEAGVPVRAVHVGAESANTDKIITGFDLDEQTLTIVGHGLSVGDRIRGRGYDSSNSWLKQFVHFHKAGTAGIGIGVIAPWKYV